MVAYGASLVLQKSYKPRSGFLLLCGVTFPQEQPLKTERTSTRVAYTPSTVNVITAVFMVLFHIAAIAAFWFFSWTNVIVALVLHWLAGPPASAWLPQAAHAPGLQDVEGVRILPAVVAR
jgi:hypothetical protein